MPRISLTTIPVFIAATALVLASPSLHAQQEHQHESTTGAGHTCACCGKSGSTAMNHAAGGGCCGGGAMAQAGKPAEDHSAHAAAGAPAAKGAEAETGASCCGNMNHGTAAKAEAKPMDHGAAGCGGGMKHDAAAKADAKPMDHGAGGCCGGMKHDAADAKAAGAAPMTDMQVFHFLLENRAHVTRTVTHLPNGIDTLTESDRPEIAAKIKEHVAAMYARLKDGKRIHQRDPLFVELFEHADQIDANITYTEKGLRVVETSTDPAVAVLLHKHAATVDGFIKNGRPEMMKDHLE